MSFTSNEGPALTNELNGYTASGPTVPITPKKSTKSTKVPTTKASLKPTTEATAAPKATTELQGSGNVTPVSPTAATNTNTTTDTTTTSTYVPIRNDSENNSFDPVFGGLIPLLIVVFLMWLFWKFMVHSIKKTPPRGGMSKNIKK